MVKLYFTEIKYGTLSGGSTMTFFQDSKIDVYHKVSVCLKYMDKLISATTSKFQAYNYNRPMNVIGIYKMKLSDVELYGRTVTLCVCARL